MASLCRGAQDSTDWLLLYYIPYDNDLSTYADSILVQLEEAKNSNNTRVVVQIDRSDKLGMVRYVYSKNENRIDTITSERSTHKSKLNQFFRWSAKEFSAKHSAVFILDHGGGLNELGLDTYPDSSFIQVKDLNKVLFRYRKLTGFPIDLLYLQVCSKASIEPLYQLYMHVEYTLASQELLGAPNYYYRNMIRSLEVEPECDGKELAQIIANSERSDMLQSLTCINNEVFPKLRIAFRRFAQAYKNSDTQINSMGIVSFAYAHQNYWDLIDFLQKVDAVDPLLAQRKEDVLRILKDELIVFHHLSKQQRLKKLNGISILELSESNVKHFWWSVPFYSDFWINKLVN
jgi:hypothetical protein